MRTIKPACSSVITRCIEHKQQFYLGVSVLTHIPLLGSCRLGAEQTLWPMLAKFAPTFIEEAIPRTRSEFLLYGRAYPQADGDLLAYVDFGIRVGQLSKKGRAFGRRVMQDSRLVVRDPVEAVAIIPENAFGGPGYAENQPGTGHPSSADGTNVELPKIELLSHPWNSETTVNQAALFGQIDIMHPLRQSLAGTYGDEWLQNDYPGMPEDTNWGVFNTALPEQQQELVFSGDETFDLINLRSDHPHINNRLPGIGARVLLQFKNDEDSFKDLPTSLRSLVFLPEANSLVMIWQAQCKINSDDASDVELLMSGFDHLSSPQTVDHYLAVRDKLLDEEDGMLASLDESSLVPEGVLYDNLLSDMPDMNTPANPDSQGERQRRSAERSMKKARDEVIAVGLDPDVHAPPEKFPPVPRFPPLPEMGEFIRQLTEEAEQQTAALKQEHEDKIEATAADYEAQGMDFDVIRKEMAGPDDGAGPGPPIPTKEPTLANLRVLDQQAQSQGEPVEEIQEMLADAELHQQWDDADQKLLQAYRMSAHHQPSYPRSGGDGAIEQKNLVVKVLRQGNGLSNLNLSGADLSGIDLSGIDCRRVLLESADLRNSNLSGACFAEAVLAHADLRGANMQNCDFQNANLGKANLEDSDASRALFTGAELEKTKFSRSRLHGAVFKNSQWLELELIQCDLTGADFRDAQLLNCNLSGSQFSAVLLDEAVFADCNFEDSSWRNCNGENVSFVNINAPDIDFSGAILPGSRWAGEINLSNALFTQAQLKNAYFGQESVLISADFKFSQAAGCDFTACNLQAADFHGAYLRGASFRKAQLSLADLSSADLMEASLQNALLQGAKLLGTHLYAADLARIHTDGHTQAEGATYTKARVYPRNKTQGSTG